MYARNRLCVLGLTTLTFAQTFRKLVTAAELFGRWVIWCIYFSSTNDVCSMDLSLLKIINSVCVHSSSRSGLSALIYFEFFKYSQHCCGLYTDEQRGFYFSICDKVEICSKQAAVYDKVQSFESYFSSSRR